MVKRHLHGMPDDSRLHTLVVMMPFIILALGFLLTTAVLSLRLEQRDKLIKQLQEQCKEDRSE